KEQEDRDAGLLHGRPDRVSHLRGGAGPRRRGRLVSRRRTRHRPAEQSAFAGREEQGAVPDRDCLERRSALAERKERAQGDLRKSQIAGRDRSLLWGSRLVPAGFPRLQRTGRRKGVEAAAGAVRQGAGLVLHFGTARTRTVPKGIRDIASGLFVAILMACGSAHVLGWLMLAATLIPVADAVIVLHQGGSRTVAFGVHGGTAVAMLIISGLLLID